MYKIEIDTSGKIKSYELAYGDSIFEEFIISGFKDYLFKPAVNKYGDKVLSKLMIPIIFDFSNDTIQISK